MDHVGEALRALRAAETGVAQAEARARTIVADARSKRDAARKALAEAIVAEYEAGARVSDLAVRASRNRETIRRILRAAGVEAE